MPTPECPTCDTQKVMDSNTYIGVAENQGHVTLRCSYLGCNTFMTIPL